MIVERIQTPGAGEVVKIELVCSDFDDEIAVRYTNKCSPGCAEGMKMFHTPMLRGSSIHAYVCAGRFELVTKLSKEWWVRKAAAVLGWDETKIREQIDPVWASKVRTVNNYQGSRSVAKAGNTCIGCQKPIARGFDLCFDCAEGKPVKGHNYGRPEDLDF
jgi:hypothetical protein